MSKRKIVIVGGVAAGASAAAKARRCDEDAEILVFEKDAHISYANCGLPYYLGRVIKKRDELLISDADFFQQRFKVDVKTRCEVVSIDPKKKKVSVINHLAGDNFEESYDKLILAPGAKPLMPPIAGIDLPFVFNLKTLSDTDRIYGWIKEKKPKKVVVVGGGLIGIEAVENFVHLGMEVSIIEFMPQLLTFLDAEMSEMVRRSIAGRGVHMHLSEKVTAIKGQGKSGTVETSAGRSIEADLIIMSVGIRPNIDLALKAGLEIGETGGIKVNNFMQTSDADIYAAGDCVESINLVTGKPALVPMGSAANKQGRAAGANAIGRLIEVKGFTGTVIVKAFDLAVGKTGLSERDATEAGYETYVNYVLAGHHAGYYPGAKTVHLKTIVEKDSGVLLGAQAIGEEGVDKRIDIMACAIYNKMKADDLQHLDLAYAPPYSSARDPIIIAGMLSQNTSIGEWSPISPKELHEKIENKEDFVLVDVRTKGELRRTGIIPGAIHLPVDELRDRIDELDKGKEIVTYCAIGLRSYLSNRILSMNGFQDVKTLSGGIASWTYPTALPV